MAHWRCTLDISAEHAAYERFRLREEDNVDTPGEAIDPAELGRRVAGKVRELAAHPGLADRDGDILRGLAEEFEAVGEEDEPVVVYDMILSELYDWGDLQDGPRWGYKMCWIETDGKASAAG